MPSIRIDNVEFEILHRMRYRQFVDNGVIDRPIYLAKCLVDGKHVGNVGFFRSSGTSQPHLRRHGKWAFFIPGFYNNAGNAYAHFYKEGVAEYGGTNVDLAASLSNLLESDYAQNAAEVHTVDDAELMRRSLKSHVGFWLVTHPKTTSSKTPSRFASNEVSRQVGRRFADVLIKSIPIKLRNDIFENEKHDATPLALPHLTVVGAPALHPLVLPIEPGIQKSILLSSNPELDAYVTNDGESVGEVIHRGSGFYFKTKVGTAKIAQIGAGVRSMLLRGKQPNGRSLKGEESREIRLDPGMKIEINNTHYVFNERI